MTCQSVVPLSFARQSPLATAPPPEIARSRFPGAGLADLPDNQQFASVTFLRPPRGVAFRAEHWTGSTSCLQENDNLVLDLADPAGPTKRADRPHATAQRDLAGHRNVAARRNAGHHRRSRSPRRPQTDRPWGLPPPARARGSRGDRTRCRNRPRASARRTPPPRSTPYHLAQVAGDRHLALAGPSRFR